MIAVVRLRDAISPTPAGVRLLLVYRGARSELKSRLTS